MLDGAAPKNEPIKMNADPVCVKENTTPQFQETYEVGSDGKSLANVFVYVKDGLGSYVFDTPTESAKIDQKDCRYHPHVFGVRVNQPIEILNSDDTLHNVHGEPHASTPWNFGLGVPGARRTITMSCRDRSGESRIIARTRPGWRTPTPAAI